MKNDSGSLVIEGDIVRCSRGEEWEVCRGIGAPPHKSSSTGRIWVKQKRGDWNQEFFPSVFNCKWVEVDDEVA